MRGCRYGPGRVLVSLLVGCLLGTLGTIAVPGDRWAPPTALGAAVVTIETPAAAATVHGQIRVSGWAADPASKDRTGVEEVSSWLDGAPDADGRLLGQALYGVPRTDVIRTTTSAVAGSNGTATLTVNINPAQSGNWSVIITTSSGRQGRG